MLKDTLVVWSGEFGRTPFAQGSNACDHNPFGFTIWMAGGGANPASPTVRLTSHYRAVEKAISTMHATMRICRDGSQKDDLLLRRRDMRLTDVHGHVADDLIA